MSPLRILVTGANGFVGRAVVAELRRQGHRVTGAIRDVRALAACGECRYVGIGDIGAATDWREALAGVDVVVHLAARVHVMREAAADPLAEFRATNVLGTRQLAAAAAGGNVRRLVFMSSIKVNGEATEPGLAFAPDDLPSPQDAYGQSKWEAEQALGEVAARTGLEVVILRPPLVYGPGVGANFLRLLRLVETGLPLPFGSIRNRRSMVFVGNLACLVGACAVHPGAAGRTFLVSDGDDLSTPRLIRQLAAALECKARLWPCPPALLNAIGMLTGRRQEFRRLLDSLVIDSGLALRQLGWRPPFSVAEGLAQTARWYRSRAMESESVPSRRL